MNLFSRLLRYLTFALAIAGVFMMGQVMKTLHGQEKPIPPPPIRPPEKQSETDIGATGILEARDENVAIGVPGPGLVQEVKVVVNQVVNQGDALLRLDDRELQASLLRQKAAVAVAAANLTVAQAQLAKMQDMLDRLKSVPDQRAISQDDLRNRSNDVLVAKAQMLAAEAQLTAAKAEVEQTELLVQRLTVLAPRDGTILQVNIRAGEYASPQNRQPALVLGDIAALRVRADVDEQNAVSVEVGGKAQVSLKGDSAQKFEAKFIRVEPYVIPKVSLTGASTERVDTRVLQVIYEIVLPSGKKAPQLYVGMQVDVSIPRKKP